MLSFMFKTYGRLFATPGGLKFSVAGLVARMPISMDSLAVIFIVVHASHSYTLAGALAAVASVVVSMSLPFWSRTSDRIGQRRTLLIAIPLRTLFLAIFIILVTLKTPTWTWFVAIIAAESAAINAGGLVRRRWLWALGNDRPLINTAYSYEALMDEIVFILGPVIATACATSIAPAAGLIVGLVFMLVGTTAFALQTKTEPPAHPQNLEEPHPPVFRNVVVQAVVLPCIFLGGFFSAVGITVVAYAQNHHAASRTGIILAIWAAGSAVAATVNGLIKWKLNHAQRFLRFLIALTLLSVPLLFTSNLIFLSAALFVSGLAVAPLIIAAYGVAETSVPPSQITETLAWVVAGMPLGGAFSSAIAGWVIDNYGAQRAFFVPLGCLCASLAMSLPYLGTWNRLRSAL